MSRRSGESYEYICRNGNIAMKMYLACFLIATFSSAECRISDVLLTLRPNAEWVLYGDTTSGLQWLDKKQSRPTDLQINSAIATCQQAKTLDDSARAQAKIDLNSTTKTDTQRIDAIIKYLGLDK